MAWSSPPLVVGSEQGQDTSVVPCLLRNHGQRCIPRHRSTDPRSIAYRTHRCTWRTLTARQSPELPTQSWMIPPPPSNEASGRCGDLDRGVNLVDVRVERVDYSNLIAVPVGLER